jgi:LPXTG-motif cell wall-anchored protein
VTLTYNNGEAPLDLPEFKFVIGRKNAEGNYEAVPNAEYTIGSGTVPYTTDENGVFRLHANETVYFGTLSLDNDYQIMSVDLDELPGYQIAGTDENKDNDNNINTQAGTLTDKGTLAFIFPIEYTARHFDLQIVKQDGDSSSVKKLAKAQFKLYTDKECTALYAKDELVTDEDGKATLKDLKEGTYYLKETVAPPGYIIMTEPVEIVVTRTLDKDDNEILSVTTKQDKNAVIQAGFNLVPNTDTNGTVDTLQLIVKDDKGKIYTLPSTGGPGTGWYRIIGAVIMVLAGLLWVKRKSRRA